MGNFFSTLFKGNKSNEASEYAEFLVVELEKLKKESGEALERERISMRELQSKMEEAKQENITLQQKLEQYTGSYDKFANIMNAAQQEIEQTRREAGTEAEETLVNAKIEAKQLKERAKADAIRLLSDTKAEAGAYKKKIEAELEQKQRESMEQYQQARLTLTEYVNSVNNMQSRLIEAYNEMGDVIIKIPLWIEDVLSDPLCENIAEKNGSRVENAVDKKGISFLDESGGKVKGSGA